MRTPPGLDEAIRERGGRRAAARAQGRWSFWRVEAPEGPLLARATRDPAEAALLTHEAEVRRAIGDRGPLRAPRVLALGAGWMLEPWIEREPWRGAAAMELLARAAEKIAALRLPVRSVPPLAEPALDALRRRAAMLRSPRLLRHAVASRRVGARLTLPVVTAHRDLDPGNALLAGGAVWVIDWEMSGPGRAGEDLLRFWSWLEDEADRETLFEAAIALVGEGWRGELERLRYVQAARTAADRLGGERRSPEDVGHARRLIGRLQELRP